MVHSKLYQECSAGEQWDDIYSVNKKRNTCIPGTNPKQAHKNQGIYSSLSENHPM